MATITVGTENGIPIDLFYEDQGAGQPVVLLHGFPLDGRSWERQRSALIEAGYRVIAHDRRGFGQSSQPIGGFDYDTFTADVHQLIEHLDLRDAILVGFSMGTGEVARYLGTYGSGRIAKAVMISSIPPFLLRTADNPEGLPQSAFDEIKAAILADRFAYLDGYFATGFRHDLDPSFASEATVRANFVTAAGASAHATWSVVDTWLTDWRADLAAFDVPTLLIHGTEDQNTPIDQTGRRLPALIAGSRLIEIEGAPHHLNWSHADQVNAALLEFFAS